MSKKRKTTNVGRVVKNDVEEANTHRRRLEINLGVIRVDFECKALNEEQRKQLQEHALEEETRKKKEKLFLSLSRVFGLFLFVRAKKIFLLLLCDISHMRVFRRKSVRGMLNSSFFSTHSRYARRCTSTSSSSSSLSSSSF